MDAVASMLRGHGCSGVHAEMLQRTDARQLEQNGGAAI